MAGEPLKQLALPRYDFRLPSTGVPLFLAGAGDSGQLIVQSALEAAGWRFLVGGNRSEYPDPADSPVAIVNGRTADSADWEAFVGNGGSLVLIDPDPETAALLGLTGYEGTLSEASLLFTPDRSAQPITLQVFGTISRYRHFHGNAVATFIDPYENLEIPAILSLSRGRGKILVLLFSLGEYILFLYQRNQEIAGRAPVPSAEDIGLLGIDTSCFMRPQLDLLIRLISGYISRRLIASGRPMPRFTSLPGGFPNLVAFSFDDISPSWKPLKLAWQRLLHGKNGNGHNPGQAPGFVPALMDVFRAVFEYPANYREQVASLLELFNRYNMTGSLYVLPFFAIIQNRLRITGYKGFSRTTFNFLKNSGWDVGTHIQPRRLDDYNSLRNAFHDQFGAAPAGHRGHELGWVGWIEDWVEMDRLGYAYDTTWNWGGHDGLAWMQGTSLPFHPVDRERGLMSILEIPVVAWMEDISKNPEENLSAIERGFSEYPGIYHIGGHSRLMVDRRYAGLVERILKMSSQRTDVQLGYNIAELVEYWKNREQSDLKDMHWNADASAFQCQVTSACRDGELALSLPAYWQSRKISTVRIDGKETPFSTAHKAGADAAICRLPHNRHVMEARYR